MAAATELDLSDDEFTAIRELLEKESTRVRVGRGTVEDLAGTAARAVRARLELIAG